jgi:heme exporter protein D
MTERVREFLEMGGYALYVWPSWGLALAILGGLALSARRARRAARNALNDVGRA